MLGIAEAQRGEAALWFSSASIPPCAQQLASPASGGGLKNAVLAEKSLTSMEKLVFN